jgi:hypothetical protein
MSRRTRTNLVAGAAIAVLGLLTLAGCKIPGQSKDKPTNAGAQPSAAAGGASPGTGTSAGSLPDICTLLTKDDVAGLTGQSVTQMNNEGGKSDNARYCQWQLTQGVLNVQVDSETLEQFSVRNQQSNTVDGIGETAYSLAGHLYVYQKGRVVDVYATSATSDDANLAVEKNTAGKILAKVAQ